MPTDEEMRDLVAKRAFEISQARRAEEGDELSDWLRAEAEVLDEIRSSSQNQSAAPTASASQPGEGGGGGEAAAGHGG